MRVRWEGEKCTSLNSLVFLKDSSQIDIITDIVFADVEIGLVF